jgi:acetolactate synthase-1/2/3 large subunit
LLSPSSRHLAHGREKPADIVPTIKDAVSVTQSGAPFLLEIVAKQGYDFSRYPLAGL